MEAHKNLSLDFLKGVDEDNEEKTEVVNPDEMGFLAKQQFKADQKKKAVDLKRK